MNSINNKKWLKISTNDERYTFNLEISIAVGDLKEIIEDDIFIKSEEVTEIKNNIYVWSEENRHQNFEEYIDIENLKQYFEIVNFHTIILIPFDILQDKNFYYEHPILTRNNKYGIYDIK